MNNTFSYLGSGYHKFVDGIWDSWSDDYGWTKTDDGINWLSNVYEKRIITLEEFVNLQKDNEEWLEDDILYNEKTDYTLTILGINNKGELFVADNINKVILLNNKITLISVGWENKRIEEMNKPKVKLTKKDIADKFGCDISQLEIDD